MIVKVRDRSVGIFNVNGRFYALLNRCPHQGGPLCVGPVSSLIEADGPGSVRFDRDRPMVSCPWHHWEFDLATGQSYAEPNRSRVRRYGVSLEGGEHVAESITDGSATTHDIEPHDVTMPAGHAGGGQLVPGPYKAETITVGVEDDYIVLQL